MISTVFNFDTVYIINDEWNGKADFRLVASLIRDEQRSLTKRSGRRPYQQTVLCKCNYQVTLQDDAVRAAIGALRSLTTEKVIIPLWPALQTWANRGTSVVTGGLKLVFKADWSNFALYTNVDPGWPAADDLWCPVLMGFINPTQPHMLTPDAATWDIDFQENSPAAYALDFSGATAAAAGPQPAGYATAPKLLPLQPDFHQVDEQVSVDVQREQVGFNREQLETFYPHDATRLQHATFTLQDNEPWTMLKFFSEVMGPGASFWASTWLQSAKLTADIGAADTVLHVVDTNAIVVGDYISLYAGGAAVASKKVTAKTANTITISAIGSALDAQSTLLFQLCLARLSATSMELGWKRPGAAKGEWIWEEVPPEYAIAGDETLGTTIGKLPMRVALIALTRDLRNATIVSSYFTSFEADITGLGETWLSDGNWEVGEIPRSLNLEEDVMELTASIGVNNPLNDDVALTAEAPMIVVIRYADYDGAALSNVQVVFSGDVSGLNRKGNKLTLKCRPPMLFETQLPRMIRGTMCNFLTGSNNDGSFLISAGCTLLKANWKATALVIAPVGNAFPFTLHLNTLTGVGADITASIGAARVFANFFANGWIEWGAGDIQRRLIVGSTAPVAGALDLTLHRYFNSLPPVGALVTIYPGCDGLYTTCKAYDASTNPTGKFNNYVNFGGEPFTPIANPSTSGQPNLNTRGAKK
jgi:hypothetical protein